MLRQSHLSDNDNCENEIIPGAVYISPGIYLTAEEIFRKSQLGDCLIKVVRTVIAPNRVPHLQMTSMDPQSARREKEGMKEMIRKIQ